jgi:hypothetical protein
VADGPAGKYNRVSGRDRRKSRSGTPRPKPTLAPPGALKSPAVSQGVSRPHGGDVVPNPEGENLEFDELNLPGDTPIEGGLADLGDESALSEDKEGEQAGLAEDAEAESQKESKKKKRRGKRREKKEKEGADKAKQGSGFLEAILDTSPFTVMLGLALLAILFAFFCLVMEWKSYNFDRRASDYRQRASIAPAFHSGPANTTTVAWPIDVQLTSRAASAALGSDSPEIT